MITHTTVSVEKLEGNETITKLWKNEIYIREEIMKYGGFIAYWKIQCLIKRGNSKKMALHSEVAASSSVVVYLVQFNGER